MFCSLSGEVPQEPVVTRSGGVLYEKRLIEKYLREESSSCPVTGDELTADDLLPVQASKAVRPRPIAGTSIPGLMTSLQNEWDELMLETFTLKQHLDSTRQQLAQALYQHDAACRVIARLLQERDEAKATLEALKAQGFSTPNSNSVSNNNNGKAVATTTTAVAAVGEAMEEETEEDASNTNATTAGAEEGALLLDAAVLDELSAKCAQLSQWRRGRKGIAVAAAVRQQLPQLALQQSLTPHRADSKSGVTCIAVRSNFAAGTATTDADAAASENNDSSSDSSTVTAVLSGGTDKSVLLTDLQSGKVIGKAIGHSKKVNQVGFHFPESSDTLLSASADATFKVWNRDDSSSSRGGVTKYKQSWSYGGHSNSSEVVGFSVHPTGNYAVTSGSDAAWHFLDIQRGCCLKIVAAEPYSTDINAGEREEHSCCMFHPDGLILGVGTSSGVLGVWDVREMQRVQCLTATGSNNSTGNITGSSSAAICSLHFSENGYHAATGAADGCVRLWDLRKLACVKSADMSGGAVSAVSFDSTGTYLAVGGGGEQNSQLHVRGVKDWATVVDLSGQHSKAITGVGWTADTATLVSSALDRTIKVYSMAAAEAATTD